MIDEAKKRNNPSNVDFINVDVETYLKTTEEKYDLIISIATFHHLEYASVLNHIYDKLKSNGMLVILDLYKIDTLYEYFLSFIAKILNPFAYLIHRGTFSATREEKELWRPHLQYDKYTTLKEIRQIGNSVLGNVEIKRHLFWRYSLIYRKE
ncbi:MAG: class I SAM-dependent methyltransferase [Negativicutes bacterium]|nr:class I SAM-dependent methyltransferase [Negativicutes bacterium]